MIPEILLSLIILRKFTRSPLQLLLHLGSLIDRQRFNA